MSKPVDDPAALRRLLDESGVSSQVTEHFFVTLLILRQCNARLMHAITDGNPAAQWIHL